MQPTKSQIIREIEKSKGDIIKFAQRLVMAKSVNSFLSHESWKMNKSIEKEVAKLIYNKLKEFGLKPKYIGALSNRPNVVCQLGNSGKPVLIINGHMDTVAAGDISKWKYPPFLGKVANGKLYGRGGADMKSALAAMVFVMRILSKFKTKGSLIFAAVVDEEPGACSEIGTKYLLKKGLKADACIVGEPGINKICIGTKGGYRIKIITRGESTHAGSSEWERKEEGINAVTKMAKILLALEELKLKYRPINIFKNRKPVITPGALIEGGTGANIVPDYCEAIVDIRLMPEQTKEKVKSEIRNCIKKLQQKDPQIKAEIQDLMFVPPVYISKDEKIVKILKKNAEFILKREPRIGVSGPWCDAYFFIERNIPAICGFGPEGKNIHGIDEFVYVKSVIQANKIYALTAAEFLG